MDFIIDGYNLIFQCGLQAKSMTGDALHQSRNRLLHEIATFGGVELTKRVTIVFDAAHRPPLAKTNRYRIKGVLVLYADRFDDADTMIEHLITKSIPIDSEIWYDRLIEGKFMSKTSPVKLPRPDGLVDVDWHNELMIDAVDVSAIEAELEAELDTDVAANEGEESAGIEISDPFPPGYGEDLLD